MRIKITETQFKRLLEDLSINPEGEIENKIDTELMKKIIRLINAYFKGVVDYYRHPYPGVDDKIGKIVDKTSILPTGAKFITDRIHTFIKANYDVIFALVMDYLEDIYKDTKKFKNKHEY